MLSDEVLRKQAKSRLEFKVHFLVYLAVNVFLVAENLVISPDSLWFYWTTIPWGLGLAIHGIVVYFAGSKTAEEREFQKLKAKQAK